MFPTILCKLYQRYLYDGSSADDPSVPEQSKMAVNPSSSLAGLTQAVAEFNAEAVQKEFQAAYERGDLSTVLHEHWSQYVPAVYLPAVDTDSAREDRKARRVLFRPLESFLCGGSPEPDTILRSLKDKDHPPQLCGHVFKNGEPTYSCRDCGLDPTCVLCIQCFNNSAHRQHRYKMSTSGGGGYCDCGDVEAWKSEPFCDIHKRGLAKKDQEEKDPVRNLSPDMRKRAWEMFLITINYAVDLLTWPEPDHLPSSLQPTHVSNTYTTMLFNDEVHTYEQVIMSLERAIDCTHKDAVDFATTVDREGRCSVKNGNFNECEKARNLMERSTSRHGGKPLKVLVMHTSVVSHQAFAQKILSWLQHIMTYSDGLRQLFCLLSMTKQRDADRSLVEQVMAADTKLWKSARVLSHQLFMAGVLMNQDCKKQFATLFTKIYPWLMRNFISDDHDYTVCAVSESVQIFTVPTLARMLITKHNLLHVILSTFLAECEGKKNSEGKFSLERNERSQSFRRAQYMLYDLKYALTTKPLAEEWNDDFRTNFMNGYKALLDLLKCMQGMDSTRRQTGQHVEFEPEWEGAFNLQLKLADNIAEILDWCSTDKTVVTNAFKATIDALSDCESKKTCKRAVCSVSVFKAECIKYDVSSQPVSIHLPVSRLLAGLYPLMNQMGISLPDIHRDLKVDIVKLIEPVLCTQVMIAQSQAGMWRRNGYSILNQIYFYHNVRCRREMADKDLVLLQAAAALIDPNEFLIHVLNKFGLLKWARQDYDNAKIPAEDLVRQTVILAEEFLVLLIHILSERFLPGVATVGPRDAVKREIIHQLFIKPMSHSELTKALPEDPNHETGLEQAVLEVATFRKPAGTGKGMYELKPEYYKDYNPFFYHYVRAEQSRAEEAQKKRLKTTEGEDREKAVLPPPVPPPFVKEFSSIVHLLDSDFMLYMMCNILERTAAQKSRSWSESQFEKTLHLIGIALYEEERAHKADHSDFLFIGKATHGSRCLLKSLEALIGNPNVTHDAQKDLLNWVIKTFRKMQQMYGTSMDTAEAGPSKDLLESDRKLQEERKKKAELATKRRLRVMAQMSKMQRDFIKENADLFESADVEMTPSGGPTEGATPGETVSGVMDTESEEQASTSSMKAGTPIAVGAERSQVAPTEPMTQICILCQEEQEITHNNRAMVLAAFTQKSTVLSKDRGKVIEEGENYDPLFMPASLMEGVHTSTCSHVMHADCWQRFYDAIIRARRRPARFRQHLSYDIDKMEFLCPLCETLSNTVIPLVPLLASLVQKVERKHVELSLNDWLDGLQKTVRCSIQEHKDKASEEDNFFFVPCPLSGVTKMMADSVAKNFQLVFEYVYLDSSDHFSDSIMDMLRKFSTDVYAVGLGVNPDDENMRVPIMAWSTCAYTIMTVEQCLRDEGKPLFGALASRKADCLSALVRFAAVCSQVIQPDIVTQHCVTLLSAILLDSKSQKLCETPCILDFDAFHYLVMLCLSLPTLYTDDTREANALTRIPTGDLNDQHILQLVFTTHLVQIMLTADFTNQEGMEAEEDAESLALLELYTQLRSLTGMASETEPSACQLRTYVTSACRPFLRSAALFFHYLTGAGPPALNDISETEEISVLATYLSLPASPVALLTQPRSGILAGLVKSWCRDEGVRQKLSAGSTKAVSYPLEVNQLQTLPQDYSELINKVCTFTCPKSDGDDSRAPTMCLVCGAILCSQSYCCQTDMDGLTVGAAMAHTFRCGAGTGLFLRVRECQVLLLSGKGKGCFFAPPYLDDYGETDQGLRRGNRLHLCKDRFSKLRQLWLSHSIPEEIAHSLEYNANLLSIDWHHL